MKELLQQPWPWYVGGPLIGLAVPVLLLLGNKQLGVSSSLRAICGALVPGRVEFFRYDWKKVGAWNLALAFGLVVGGFVALKIGGGSTPDIAPATRAAIGAIGLAPASSLLPAEIFSWRALLSLRGVVCIIGGGFLAGFGATYAGGCTSGHGVMGLATFQRASLIALMGIFAGGLIATFVVLPMLA